MKTKTGILGKILFIVIIFIAVATFLYCSLPVVPDALINNEQRSFTISTKRLEATFKDGMIVNLKNLKTGELICDQNYSDIEIPKGLGHISGDLDSLRKIHFPWGCTEMNQQPKNSNSQNYHYPGNQSVFSCEKIKNGIRATWTGLENSKQKFSGEMLTIEAKIDKKSGALTFSSSANSDTGGVFGTVVPLANINPECRFFLPSFGGLMYDKRDKPALTTFAQAPFMDAPVMAAETEKSSFALWKEDKQFHPYFTFFNWSGKSFSFAFEHLNLMPFEQHTNVNSCVWKLDVFEDSWMQAMTPYKNWYSKFFKKELKIRDSVEWADKIGVVLDLVHTNKTTLDKVAALFPSETVLFMEWNARAMTFGVGLPDWTPREGYIEKVKLLHDYGFKIMAYVNTYCAEYNSPVFIRDNLKEKFLTRKSAIHDYGKVSENKDMEGLIGNVQPNPPMNQFKGVKDGTFFYGDPLHPGWRKYHAEQMKWWNTTTGTDANYEDTAGCAGDFGNGIVDGKFAKQGSIAMMRELLEIQPGIPMASEYGPDAIAFAVKWPLEYAQVWGNDIFKATRIHKQYPINAFLFGYRVWVPSLLAETDFMMHLATASSDASGGMGMMADHGDYLEYESGFTGHMKWRAELFARRGLKPYFDIQKREKNIVCRYKDKTGGIYKYYDDGKVQKMVGPDGKDLYARVEKTEKLETELCIPDWPAYSENSIFGLNPNERYALFPKKDSKVPALRLASLPEGISINRYYSDDNYTVIVLDKNGKTAPDKASLSFELNKKFDYGCVNGITKEIAKESPNIKLDVQFPAYILFSSTASVPAFNKLLENDFTKLKIRKISLSSGLQELILTNDIKKLERTMKISGLDKPVRSIVLWGSLSEKNVDFLIKTPSQDSSLKIYVKNINALLSGESDCTIAKAYINGKLMKSLDSKVKNPNWRNDMPTQGKFVIDLNYHEWIIPIGEYAGNNILVTIASDPKQRSNCDQQWISIPMLIQDAEQKPSDKIMPDVPK